MKKGSLELPFGIGLGPMGGFGYAACVPVKFWLYPPLNDGLNAPGNGAKPLNGVFDSKFPSLFHSEPSFHPLLFHAGVLVQPLNDGAKPLNWLKPWKPLNGVLFHAPGVLFQPLNGVFHPEFQFCGPKFPGKPDHGVEPVFEFQAPGNEPQLPPEFPPQLPPKFVGKLPPQLPPKFVGKLPPQLPPQFEFVGNPPVKPGKPVPGKFDANGVLNMLCFLLWCRVAL